eukprot:s2311_g4.t1
MAAAPKEATSLVYPTDALKARAIKSGLSGEEVEAMIDNNVKSLAQLAFTIAPPGTSPSEQAVRDFFGDRVAATRATVTSVKLFIFEAHTLVVANIKSEVTRKDEPATHSILPAAERERRIKEQHERLKGLRFKGDEERAHANYDLVFAMIEKDNLTYIARERFVTRRYELQQKKPGKEVFLDHNSLTVKDKQGDLSCSTKSELELFQAMRRRALTFDLLGLCSYEIMNNYHSELLQHMQEEAPPGYSSTTLVQVLKADRAAFLHIAENMSTLKRDTANVLPLEKHLPGILARPNVSFHLLPLATAASHRVAQPTANPNKRKLGNDDVSGGPAPKQSPTQPKGKGKGNNKGKRKGRGPNVPRDLIGKALQTPTGNRICLALQHGERLSRCTAWPEMPKRVTGVRGARLFQAAWAVAALVTNCTARFVSRPALCNRICRPSPTEMSGRRSQYPLLHRNFCRYTRLSAVLKQIGLRDSFGIDHTIHPKVTGPVIALDLRHETSFQYVLELIQQKRCIYCHFAPPCGAASRARFIKRKFRYNPPVLRTDQHPNGVPTLKGQFLARVQAANHLYDVTQKFCRACHAHGVLFSIENPARSFFWQTTHVLQFLADVPHFCIRLHHCMFGSARRKYTLLVHNVPTLQELAIECDNSHPHEPCGTTDTGGWATALETAYPWALCRAIAAKVALYLQQLGTICVTPAFALQTVQLEHIRRDTGLQISSKAVPLVSEFKEVLSWPVQEPLPALARALSTPVVGEIATENFRTIGVHRSPEEFIIEALEAKHPCTG